ncbi:unnamed protein product, partial [Mesorhabditis spiculigera]
MDLADTSGAYFEDDDDDNVDELSLLERMAAIKRELGLYTEVPVAEKEDTDLKPHAANGTGCPFRNGHQNGEPAAKKSCLDADAMDQTDSQATMTSGVFSLDTGCSQADLSSQECNGSTPPCPEADVKPETAEPDDGDDFDPIEYLEKGIDDSKSQDFIEKIVPQYRRTDIIEPLPPGWREITHSSGVPVYLHQQTRVCVFARPYHLGKGSARFHQVPLCAIPCLHERKVNALFDQKKLEAEKEGTRLVLGDIQLPKQADDLNAELKPAEMNEYAKGVFRFQTIRCRRPLHRWKERAEKAREEKALESQRLIDAIEEGGDDSENVRRCVLPKSVVMAAPQGLAHCGKPGRSKHLTVAGKTAVNILHDYSSKFLRSSKPYYHEDTEARRSANMPYQFSLYVKISPETRMAFADNIREKLAVLRERERLQNGDEDDRGQLLGRGKGASKKEAKRQAAEEAVKLLLAPTPIRFNADGEAVLDNENASKVDMIDEAADTCFDTVAIDDPKVAHLTPGSYVPTPLDLLKRHLQQSAVLANVKMEWTTEKLGQSRVTMELKLGDFVTKQTSDRRMTAEQLCAQQALKHLHNGEIKFYGALLRVYNQDSRYQYEAMKEQKAVTRLQTAHASRSTGNAAVLSKLCEELKKLERAMVVRKQGLCHSRDPV